MLLLFLLPAYLVRFKAGIPLTLLEVMIWVVFFAWLIPNLSGLKKNLSESFKSRKEQDKLRLDYYFKWEMILLLIISFISVGVVGFSNEALGIWKAYFFEPILLFVVVFNVFGKNGLNESSGSLSLKRIFSKIILPLSFSAFFISIIAVYQKITGQFIPNPLWSAEATRRVTSVFGYPNAVGLYLEAIILLMVGYLSFTIARRTPDSIRGMTRQSQADPDKQVIARNKVSSDQPEIATLRCHSVRNDRVKIIFLSAVIILSMLSIIFAKSVGASLGVGIGLILFALLSGRRIRWMTIGVLLIAVISIASYQPARHEALKYLTLNDFSGQVRKAQWRETWEMLKTDNHWLWGSGLSGYQEAIKPFHQEGIFVKDYDDPAAQRKLVFNEAYRKAHWQPLEIYMYPHNIILNFWTELGLAGLLLFVWIVLRFYYLGFKIYFKIESLNKNGFILAGVITAMTAMIIHGLVDVPYFKNDLSVIFWILIAMMELIIAQIKFERES